MAAGDARPCYARWPLPGAGSGGYQASPDIRWVSLVMSCWREAGCWRAGRTARSGPAVPRRGVASRRRAGQGPRGAGPGGLPSFDDAADEGGLPGML